MGTTVSQTPPKSKGNTNKAFALLGVGGSVQGGPPSKKTVKELKAQQVKIAKENEKEHKKQLEVEKARVLDEAALQQHELALQKLTGLVPAADKQYEKVNGAIEAAKLLAAAIPPDFAKANAALGKVKPGKEVEEGRAAWNKIADNLNSIAPEINRMTREIVDILARQTVLPPQGKANYRASMIELVRPMMEKKPKPEDVQSSVDDLGRLLDGLKFTVEQATSTLVDVSNLSARVSRLLNELAPEEDVDLPLLTTREGAGYRQQQRGAKTCIDQADYATAQQTLTGLLNELGEIRSRMVPLRDGWVKAAEQLPEAMKAVDELVQTATAPAVKEELAVLRASLVEITTLGPGKGIAYPEATARVEGVAGRLVTLRQTQTDWANLNAPPTGEGGTTRKGAKAPIDLAKGRINTLLADVEISFAQLHKSVLGVDDGADGAMLDGPFRERLQAIVAAWGQNQATATTEEQLDEKGIAAQIVGLQKEIDGLAGDAKALAARLGDAKSAQALSGARGLFDAARTTAMGLVDRLIAIDAPPGTLLARTMELLDTDVAKMTTPEELANATTEATGIGVEAQRQITALQDTVTTAQNRIKTLLDTVPGKLDELFKAIEKTPTAAKQQPLTALHETLQTSYDTLRALQKSTQLAVLLQAMVEAEQLANEVVVSVGAATGSGGDVDEGGALTFSEVRKQIVDLKGALDATRVKTYCVETATNLTEELTKLEKELGGTTMSALTKTMNALAQKVAAVVEKAKAAKEACKVFEAKVELVRKDLKKPDYKDVPDFVGAMGGRLDGIISSAKYENGLEAAEKQLAAVSLELQELLASDKSPVGVPLKLEQANGKVIEDRRKAEMDKAKFEGEAEVLERAIADLRSRGGADGRDIDGLSDSLDITLKSTKKGGDYDTGRNQLFAIRKRMNLLTANPDGLHITARNKLPQVQARLKQAIIAFTAALDAVQKAVDELPETDVDLVGKKAVSDELIVVRGLFNWSVLEKPIMVITNPGSDQKARSGAREQAFRPLRQMIAYLQNEYRLQLLFKNPFNPAMPSVLSAVNLSLLDLENNLLVSL